jgi:uncharacterized protein DUF1064
MGRIGKAGGMSKYKAKKAVVDGITFASQAEARRYGELKLLLKAGVIKHLTMQPYFQLAPAVRLDGKKRMKPALRYQADFSYTENSKLVVEDVKGVMTEAFRIKQHLMATIYEIQIRVIK